MIHAITATWAFDEAKKREALSRGCPKCRRKQSAADEKINEQVACENCGAEILPPPPPSAAGAAAERKATGRSRK